MAASPTLSSLSWGHHVSPFYQERDTPFTTITADYQSITSHPHYQASSFEELHLRHYTEHGPTSQAPTTRFAVAERGLAVIALPLMLQPPRLFRSLATRAQDYGGNIVTFRVGPAPPTDFALHEALLLTVSPFVRGALNGEWKEARARMIPLPEDAPDAFRLYQHWIYNRTVPSAQHSNEVAGAEEYDLLVRAYILGEKLMDAAFKDAVINCILTRMWMDSTFDPRLAALVYDNTPASSPLRRLWRDACVWLGGQHWLDEDLLGEPVHPDFSRDVSVLYVSFWAGQRPARAPFMQSARPYHEHKHGVCVDTS